MISENSRILWLRGSIAWLGTFVVLCVINWRDRALPIWWDSAGYVYPHSREIYEAGLFPILRNYDVGHPTLFYFLSAVTMKLFGPGVFGPHLLVWGFGALTIVSIYALARSLELPRSVAFAVSLMYIVFPAVWAQLGEFLLDLPYVALAFAALAFWVRNRHWEYFAFATAASLTKIYGFTIIFGVMGTLLLTSGPPRQFIRDRSFWREVLWGLSPMLPLVIFFVIRHLVRGPGLTIGFSNASEITAPWVLDVMWRRIVFMVEPVYTSVYMHYVLIGLGVLLLAETLRIYRKKTIPPISRQHGRVILSILIWTTVTHGLLITLKEVSCPRYVTMTAALCYLLGAYILWRIIPRLGILLPISAVIIVIQIILWHPKNSEGLPPPLNRWLRAPHPKEGWRYELDLQYKDAIRLAQWSARKVQDDAERQGIAPAISTGWPFDGVLREPLTNYAKESMDVLPIDDWANVNPDTHPYVMEIRPIQAFRGSPPENAKFIEYRRLYNVEAFVWRLDP